MTPVEEVKARKRRPVEKVKPKLNMHLMIDFHISDTGLRHVTKSYRLDTSGRSEDKEAAAIGVFLRGLLDALVIRDELAEVKIVY